MGNGWAVASVTLMAVTLGVGALFDDAWLVTLTLAPAVATWAYSLLRAAQGAREGLWAATVYAALATLGMAYASWRASEFAPALTLLLLVSGSATLAALAQELRRRGGRTRVGSVIALCAPALFPIFGVAAILTPGTVDLPVVAT